MAQDVSLRDDVVNEVQVGRNLNEKEYLDLQLFNNQLTI